MSMMQNMFNIKQRMDSIAKSCKEMSRKKVKKNDTNFSVKFDNAIELDKYASLDTFSALSKPDLTKNKLNLEISNLLNKQADNESLSPEVLKQLITQAINKK